MTSCIDLSIFSAVCSKIKLSESGRCFYGNTAVRDMLQSSSITTISQLVYKSSDPLYFFITSKLVRLHGSLYFSIREIPTRGPSKGCQCQCSTRLNINGRYEHDEVYSVSSDRLSFSRLSPQPTTAAICQQL